MQHIYTVPTLDALAVYEPELRESIEGILRTAQEHGNNNRTVDEVWEEVQEHVTIAPHGRVWFALDAGVLVSWVAGKIYVDGKKRNGCITWAWAAPRSVVSREMVDTAEAYFRERECQRAYLGRAFLQPAFTRLMRRYGYALATVVYEKPLGSEVQHGDTIGSPRREVGDGDADDHGGSIPATGTDAGAAADVRRAGSGVPGANGEAAGDGNQCPDAAGGVAHAGNGAADGAGGGTIGVEVECPGTDTIGWTLDTGGESAGTPDAGAARPPPA